MSFRKSIFTSLVSIFIVLTIIVIVKGKEAKIPVPNIKERDLPVIILVSFDTLRADHLGCYGYPKATSPNIDNFSRYSCLFQREIVQLPGTLPSHMSIFTSLYPRQHDVYPPDARLSTKIQTLAEILTAHGYTTAGYTEGGYVSGRYGFDRGFSIFSDKLRGWDKILNAGIQVLKNKSIGTPTFLFLHTYQTHDPYFPPKPFDQIYTDRSYVPSFEPTGPNLASVNKGIRKINSKDINHFKGLYDAEIRYTDSLLPELFKAAQERCYDHRSMMIITSDHGEEFMEHGKLVHEQLYEPIIHVPLIVNLSKDLDHKIVSSPVESVDILPTILEYTGVPENAQCQGYSLIKTILEGKQINRQNLYSESFVVKGASINSIDSDMKYIQRNHTGGGRHMSATRDIYLSGIGNELKLKMRGYNQSRNVKVFWENIEVAQFSVPEKWSVFTVSLPQTNENVLTTIHLMSDSCDVPHEISDSEDDRCIALFLAPTESVPLEDFELYDLKSDPAETDNLFLESLETKNKWKQEVTTTQKSQQPVGGSLKIHMDKLLLDELKALGYIN
ncbi:sulfatase [bacterium]|nr:sulfatase [candidate division CSSED10-310 bacterium]